MKQTNTNSVSLLESLGNVGFAVKLLFHVNRKVFFTKFFKIVLQLLSSLVPIFYLRSIINGLTEAKSFSSIAGLVIGMVFGSSLLAFFNRLISMIDSKMWECTAHDVNMRLGESITKLPFSDIEDTNMRDYITLAVSSDSYMNVVNSIFKIIESFIGVITFFTIVVFIQPIIIIVIIVDLLLRILIKRANQRHAYKYRVQRQPLDRKFNYYCQVLCDRKYGKEIRTGQLQNFFLNKAEKQFSEIIMPQEKKYNFKVGLLCFAENTSGLFQSVVLHLLLGMKVIADGMPIGDFSLYISSSTQLAQSITGLIDSISDLVSCGMFLKEFRYCITYSKLHEKNTDSKNRIGELNTSIEFRNVSFKYPNCDDFVLKSISFKINQGEKVSLVGPNGSGKTTLVKLLCHFYEPTEGDILIGGINTKELSEEEYKRLLSVAFQDYLVYPMSVAENIAMDIDYDSIKVNSCANKTGLKRKIDTLKYGVDTSVFKEFDENGVEFSGGEAQRLALARALYKDAPIFIFDEPTASLDPIAEFDLFNSMNKFSDNKTVFFISHRLSLTRSTDLIVVLSDGKLCELGSHNELMKNETGLYREMFNMQAQYYA